MRHLPVHVLVICVLVLALSGSTAGAATFAAPETIATGATLATAAVAGGAGQFALVARRQGAMVGAVRRGAGSAWQVRTLATSRAYSMRDPQIVMDADGTATALWTAESPHSALVAARAPTGAGFGRARVVARVDNASGARPRMVALGSGRVLVVFSDRPLVTSRRLGSQTRLKTIQLDRGRASAVRDLGVEGAFPAIARAGTGALLVYLAGAPRCTRSTCARRPLRATLLDAAGRRSGPTVAVAADGGSYFTPPRVTSAGSRAVVSWVRPGRGTQSPMRPFTRTFSTRPLQALAGARAFPSFGGPGTGTPSAAILRGGDLLGANVGQTGRAELSVAPGAGAWAAPTGLSPSSGWTTVPRVSPLGTGGALAIFAYARPVVGPAVYDVVAVERSPAGALTQRTLGSTLRTSGASGLSSSVAADDQAIVTWPNALGGVDAVLGT